MLHHHPPASSKYHPNSLTQFLAMHHQQQQQHQNRVASPPPTILDDMDSTETTQIDSAFGGNIGKSFTIAAILGLKKNAAAAAAAVAMEHHHSQHQLQHHPHPHHNHPHPNSHHHQPHHPHHFHLHNMATANHSGREYSSVMNLSINNSNLSSATTNNSASLNNNNINHSNNNHRMPVSLEKHLGIQQHHQQTHSLHNATSALQSLQQLQQVHGGGGSAFTGRERSKNDHIASKKNSLKSKRVRTIFTPEQLERLESEFERQQYMVGPERLYLAHTLQLTEAQVKVWFQNRRIKWRKHHLELTQQKLAMIRQHQGPPTAAAISTPTHSPSPTAPPQPPAECDVSVCSDSMDSRGSVHEDDGDNGD